MRQKARKNRRHGKRIVLTLLVLILTISAVLAVANQTVLQDFLHFNASVASMEHGWNLILVNGEYKIPKDWKVELTELSNGQSVDSRIYPDLQQMFDDMRTQGVYPVVASGYRTAKKQQELMDEKVNSFLAQGYSKSEAKSEAKKWVAGVGYSEHQTGLAVDINADGVNSSGQQVYAWLADNAWKYGFILRYPEDKTEITKTDYEPWHYRYVGKEAAKEIYESGLCLEEYIGMMQTMFALSSAVGLLLRIVRGIYTVELLPATVLGTIGILLGKRVGLKMLKKISKENMMKLVYSMIAVSGILTIAANT